MGMGYFCPKLSQNETEFSLTKAIFMFINLCRQYVTSTLKNTICVQVLNWIFHWVIKISVTFHSVSMKFVI